MTRPAPRSRFLNAARFAALLVAATMAIAASPSASRAEFGASWFVEGTSVNGGLSPAVGVFGLEAGVVSLSTEIAKVKVQVSCSSMALIGVKLESEGKVTKGGKAKFSGCTVKLNGATSGPCEPSNQGKEPGVILSKAGKGLLALHETPEKQRFGLVRIEPAEGETLATIEMSEECSIGEKVPIIGKLTARDAFLESEFAHHFVEVGPLTEMWAISKTAEHKATAGCCDVIVHLEGTHHDKFWSGEPG